MAEIYYTDPDGQPRVAREGDTIPDGSTILGGHLEVNGSLTDLPDYYYRQPDLPDASLTAGEDIEPASFVYLGSDGRIYATTWAAAVSSGKAVSLKDEVNEEDSSG